MPLLRRRPLLRGAIVGGAVYHMGKSVARGEAAENEQNRQLEELQASQQNSYSQNTMPQMDETDQSMKKIQKLQAMHESGVLTDEEFSQAKSRILTAM